MEFDASAPALHTPFVGSGTAVEFNASAPANAPALHTPFVGSGIAMEFDASTPALHSLFVGSGIAMEFDASTPAANFCFTRLIAPATCMITIAAGDTRFVQNGHQEYNALSLFKGCAQPCAKTNFARPASKSRNHLL